mmetsp:Transcript_95116/g.290914  ORF Transcript_95116/g.290914 Transcript_95116/m.290914 type:complete len:205 (-) Transcript_95116:393-1007(-)
MSCWEASSASSLAMTLLEDLFGLSPSDLVETLIFVTAASGFKTPESAFGVVAVGCFAPHTWQNLAVALSVAPQAQVTWAGSDGGFDGVSGSFALLNGFCCCCCCGCGSGSSAPSTALMAVLSSKGLTWPGLISISSMSVTLPERANHIASARDPQNESLCSMNVLKLNFMFPMHPSKLAPLLARLLEQTIRPRLNCAFSKASFL